VQGFCGGNFLPAILVYFSPCWYAQIASCAVLGGEQYAIQKKNLDRLVDVVVASPGRLMQHKEQGNVYFSQVSHVIIDEVDTMLMQGFGSDIRAILRSVMKRNNKSGPISGSSGSVVGAQGQQEPDKDVQLIMSTATLTKAVRALLTDVEGGFNIEYTGE
jgi:superfamily II DNA/RNA helicase